MAGYKGRANGNARLTEAEVLVIRRRYGEGITQGELCRIYRVSCNTIARVVRRETWAWLGDQDAAPVPVVPPATGESTDAAAASLARLQTRLQAEVDKLPETGKELLDELGKPR